MIVNDRIEILIKHYKLNNSTFSKKIGLENNVTIGNIVGGRRTKPSFDTILKIIEAFPEINLNWLIKGNGEMLKEKNIEPYNLPENENLRLKESTATYTAHKSDENKYLIELIETQKKIIKQLEEKIEELSHDKSQLSKANK